MILFFFVFLWVEDNLYGVCVDGLLGCDWGVLVVEYLFCEVDGVNGSEVGV